MNCDRARHLISESFDRRLSPAERMEMADHLRSCAGCTRFERSLHSGLDSISRLPEIAPTQRLWEAVHTRTAAAPGVTPARIAKQAAGMLGAAAAVALVAVLTIFLLNNHAPTTTNPQTGSGVIASPTSPVTATSALVRQATPPEQPAPAVATPTSSTPVAGASPDATASIASVTSPSPTSTPAPPGVDQKTAEATVIGYFHAINLGDYATAYGYLGAALQQGQSLSDFTEGYAGSKHDTLTITGTKPNDQSGQVVVIIYLDAEQADGSVRHYHGQYVVGYENRQPKIVDATVNEDLPSTPTSTPDASASACLAGDLSATAGYQGATGSMAGSIIFTNTGAKSCSLRGTASVRILDSNGTEMVTKQQTMSLDGRDQPVTLIPGGQAFIFFQWFNWCPAGTTVTSAASPVAGGVSFQVTLPGRQGSITVAATGPGSAQRGLLPRCDAPGQPSTLSVGTFRAYPPS